MVSKESHKFEDLVSEVAIPDDGIVSRTLHQDDHIKVVLFGFSPGQELSEHTASMPAIMHFVTGEAQITLGDQSSEARAGTWVHMPANLSHSVAAKSQVVMLLTLLKLGKPGASVGGTESASVTAKS